MQSGFRTRGRACLAGYIAVWLLGCNLAGSLQAESPRGVRHLLYVAEPGIRDELKYGGAGILVFDIDRDHAFVIAHRNARQPGEEAGECQRHLRIGRDGAAVFEHAHAAVLPGLEDEQAGLGNRPARRLRPDVDYARRQDALCAVAGGPALEYRRGGQRRPRGQDRAQERSAQHRVQLGWAARVYCAGLQSPLLTVVDTASQKAIGTVGPFSAAIRPFTVNGKHTLAFATVNGLLGFEIGDLASGKMIERVEVKGYKQGPVQRHGCPSHGIGLSPDEREVWVCDSANRCLHIFDATVMPPKQMQTVRLTDEPGWVTFSIDGRFAYPSTGEIIDARTKKIVGQLTDEAGAPCRKRKIAGNRLSRRRRRARGRSIRHRPPRAVASILSASPLAPCGRGAGGEG